MYRYLLNSMYLTPSCASASRVMYVVYNNCLVFHNVSPSGYALPNWLYISRPGVSLPNSSFVCHPGVSLPSSTFISRPGLHRLALLIFVDRVGICIALCILVTLVCPSLALPISVVLVWLCLALHIDVALVCHWLGLSIHVKLSRLCLSFATPPSIGRPGVPWSSSSYISRTGVTLPSIRPGVSLPIYPFYIVIA